MPMQQVTNIAPTKKDESDSDDNPIMGPGSVISKPP